MAINNDIKQWRKMACDSDTTLPAACYLNGINGRNDYVAIVA